MLMQRHERISCLLAILSMLTLSVGMARPEWDSPLIGFAGSTLLGVGVLILAFGKSDPPGK